MPNTTGKKFGGRKKGTPNRTTKQLREALQTVLQNELENIPSYLEKLSPKERIDVTIKLLSFIIPKAENSTQESQNPNHKNQLMFGNIPITQEVLKKLEFE